MLEGHQGLSTPGLEAPQTGSTRGSSLWAATTLLHEGPGRRTIYGHDRQHDPGELLPEGTAHPQILRGGHAGAGLVPQRPCASLGAVQGWLHPYRAAPKSAGVGPPVYLTAADPRILYPAHKAVWRTLPVHKRVGVTPRTSSAVAARTRASSWGLPGGLGPVGWLPLSSSCGASSLDAGVLLVGPHFKDSLPF